MNSPLTPNGPQQALRVDSVASSVPTPAANPMNRQSLGSNLGVDGWAQALDALESDLRNAEWLLSHGVGESEVLGGGWIPPENLGPLPAHYCEWVRSLLARQAQMHERLTAATARSRQRGTYFSDPSSRSTGAQSRFVDARA
jgi:hypothetical protein